MPRADYEDAYHLVGLIRNAATSIWISCCTLGGLQVLYGIYNLFFGGGMVAKELFGGTFILLGLMTGLAGYGTAMVVRGIASILLATTDTAVATRSSAQLLETQTTITKSLLAQMSVVAAKTK